jgi:hypothetical protein
MLRMEGADRADKRANEAGNGGRKESWADMRQADPSAMPESTEAGRRKTGRRVLQREDRQEEERKAEVLGRTQKGRVTCIGLMDVKIDIPLPSTRDRLYPRLDPGCINYLLFTARIRVVEI